jgi:hypothetical protein
MIDADTPEPVYTPTPLSNLPTLEGLKVNRTEEVRQQMAAKGRESLYYLCKVILGYKDLNPRVHMPMCDYYDSTRNVYKRRESLMPRTHYKTTIWTIGESILDVVNNPNVRILMIADTGTNAQRFMLEIQQHFESNPVFRWVYSELLPDNFNTARWNANEMEVPRTLIAREPTIDAIGALGGSESRHYDKIRADDLVTEKCIRSEVEMDKVIEWADGLESLLVRQVEGQIDFVGSRKKKGDLYETQLKSYQEGSIPIELGPHVTLHGEMVVFCRHVLEEGKPIFPEQISLRFLNRLRRVNPQRYHAQYANDPKGSGLNTFDASWLRTYRRTGEGRMISCIHNGEVLLEVHPMSMDRIILYDPSVAEKQTSSMQAIMCVAKGNHPFRIVLETKIGHYPPDEAVDTLFEMQERWHASIVSIEKRGFQGWVKYWLAERAEKENLPYLPVVEWPPDGSVMAQWKKTEHIRALQPMIRNNLLWMAEDQIELYECLEFYPNVRWDDAVDCLAQGLTYWPMSDDQEGVDTKKRAEIDMLDAAFGMGSTDSYKEVWDEAEFLKQFDETGYGFVEA